MKTRILILAAAVVAGAALAQARDLSVQVSHPVPAMPADGWSYASVVVSRTTTRDIDFTIESQRGGVSTVKHDVLKDNNPRRIPFIYRMDANRGNNSVTVVSGTMSQSFGSPQFGKSVLALTTSPGRVLGRIQQLDQIMDKPQDQWRGQAVVIQEHRNPKELPGNWMGYDLLQAMVMEDFPYSEMTPAQVDAIVHWVERGGTLLVSPGERGMVFDPASPLHQMVKLSTKGTDKIENTEDFGDRGPRGVMTKWNIRAEPALHMPWAEVAQCGAGQVVIFKYDFLRSPLSEWNGLTRTFEGTCHIRTKSKSSHSFPLSWSRQKDKMPGPMTIAGLLGLYMLTVGPANYLLLRRKNKLVLMPFTISGVAIAFTITIIAYGYISRGTSTEMREFTVVQTYPGRTTAQAVSQMGIHASSNRSYELEFNKNTGVRNLSSRQNSAESEIFVTDRGNAQVVSFTTAMWQTFLLEAQAPVPQFGNLRIEDTGAKLTIVNDTPVDLENCWANPDGKRWLRIGRLPSGGSVSNPAMSGEPPPAVRRAAGAGNAPMVIGQAAAKSPRAIDYKMVEGRAALEQSDIYIVGGAL